MIEGVETGYEERYDFAYRPGSPERVYILATVPRTGSTYVSHILWRSGCLGAPLEYLNFLDSSPYAFAHGQPDKQRALWRSLLHRRTSPNGVFGVKAFSTQLRELQQANPSLLLEVFATVFPNERRAAVIRLKRRDRVAHAISYARAALSGVWRKDQEATAKNTTVEYSAKAVDHARALLDQQEADWDLLSKDIGVEPLTLWYEDILKEPAQAVRAVAAFLEVDLDPAAAVAIPEIEKQSEEDSKQWAVRYGAGE
ncbi:MAG: Stf0 family sulfotransferase [Sphingomicrobium sp.]